MSSVTPSRFGYRGYITSRRVRGELTPQHVQNLVIRDYCQRNKFHYLLSAVEFAIENCFMGLDGVLQEAPKLEGIVLFSLFMLPTTPGHRQRVYDQIMASGSTLHAALEGVSAKTTEDYMLLEDLFMIDLLSSRDSTFDFQAISSNRDSQKLPS